MKYLLDVSHLQLELKKDDNWINPLKNVNLSIGYKQTLGLVGESGSGKSLTAKALLKLFSKTTTRIKAEHIRLGNIDLLGAGNKLMQKVRGAQIGLIMQDAQSCLNPTMRIRDQITESLLFHEIYSSKSKAEEEALRLLDLVEVPNSKFVLNCYPFELSGGMKQRVVIATAIAPKPKLLIADEPTSSLDIEAQDGVLNLLKMVQNEFLTSILLITHDLQIAKYFCDKISVMYAGKTVETMYKNDFAHGFHPYTQHLMNAKPTFQTPKNAPLSALKNKPIQTSNGSKCCPFFHRCPKAMKICLKQEPYTTTISEHHSTNCFLALVPTNEDAFV